MPSATEQVDREVSRKAWKGRGWVRRASLPLQVLLCLASSGTLSSLWELSRTLLCLQWLVVLREPLSRLLAMRAGDRPWPGGAGTPE